MTKNSKIGGGRDGASPLSHSKAQSRVLNVELVADEELVCSDLGTIKSKPALN